MKRTGLTGIVTIIAIVTMLSSCAAEGQQEVTEWIPTHTTQRVTESETEATVKVVKVKVETDPAAKKKETKATEATETSFVPTQGVVKPGRHIEVTTVLGSVNSKDFYFIYDSQTVKLNENIASVFKKLGEDNFSSELGKNRMEYEYGDFVLTTYTDSKGVERLEQVVITSESWATAKGAKFGYYGTALRRIYGDPASNKGGVMTYKSGPYNLIFTVENNLVTGISLKYSH